MMLEKVSLQNFQTHSKLVLTFDERITTIVGKSDVGKSAIVRALEWVFLNRPSGDAFIKDGKQFARVRAYVDGHTITRKKGKQNLYIVDGQELKAFGSKVPEPVEDILHISELNFQRQHDSVFWLSQSPGQVSRELNRIINLEVIDSSLAEAGRRMRESKSALEITEGRVQEAKKEKTSLAFVDSMDSQLKRLEKMDSDISLRIAQKEELSELILRLKQSREKQAEGRRKLSALLSLKKKASRVRRQQKQAFQLKKITNLILEQRKEACQLQHNLTEARTELKKMQKEGIHCPKCKQKINPK